LKDSDNPNLLIECCNDAGDFVQKSFVIPLTEEDFENFQSWHQSYGIKIKNLVMKTMRVDLFIRYIFRDDERAHLNHNFLADI